MLTDEQIALAMISVDDPLIWGRLGASSGEVVRQLARAIEQAVLAKLEPVAWTRPEELNWAHKNPGRAGSLYAFREGPRDIPLYAAPINAAAQKNMGHCVDSPHFQAMKAKELAAKEAPAAPDVQAAADRWVLRRSAGTINVYSAIDLRDAFRAGAEWAQRLKES